MTTDRELLHAYVDHHDDHAFAHLVERHGGMVLATCRRTTRDHQDAEEATQAVLLILSRKAASLLEIDCLGAWLHRVARFVALRRWRSSQRRRDREVVMSAAHPAREMTTSAGPGPGRDLQTPGGAELDAAIDHLPTRYRLPLLMHYLEGRSQAEIASALSMTPELVATRLSRARERLRRRIDPLVAPELGVVLAGLQMPMAADRTGLVRFAPTASAKALAASCLQAMWLIPCTLAASGMALCALLVVSLTVGWSRLHAADSAQAAGPPPAIATGNQLQPRLSVAICPRWQEALLNALARHITLQTPTLPAESILDAIGQQCGLTMVIDLAPGHSHLPTMAVDVQDQPLQQVLDEVAKRTGTKYQLYAGALLWREGSDQLPWDPPMRGLMPLEPMSMRQYSLRGLPQGTDAQMVIEALQQVPSIDWTVEGMAIEELNHDLVICCPPADHDLIEQYLRQRWKLLPPPLGAAADAPWTHPVLTAGAHGDAQSAALRSLGAQLARPLGRELTATHLRAALSELATLGGIPVVVDDAVPDAPLPERPIPPSLAHLQVRHALALLLDGTGWRAGLRFRPGGTPPGAQVAEVLVAANPAPVFMVQQYRVPAAGAANLGPQDIDPEELVDFMKKNIAASSWGLDGVEVEVSEGKTMAITQTLEQQLDVAEEMPRIIQDLSGAAMPATLPTPPPLILTPPTTAPAPAPALLPDEALPHHPL